MPWWRSILGISGHDGLRELWTGSRDTFGGAMKGAFRDVFEARHAALDGTTSGDANGKDVSTTACASWRSGRVSRFPAFFDPAPSASRWLISFQHASAGQPLLCRRISVSLASRSSQV